jgi:hypothetical protein
MNSNIIIYALWFMALTLNFSCSCSQTLNINTSMQKNNSDTVGIEISFARFNRLIQEYLIKLKDNQELTENDHIVLIRLVNTIDIYNFQNDESKELIELYYPKIFELAIIKLETQSWKGGSQYSQKHDIFIGGKPHSNSQYYITDK